MKELYYYFSFNGDPNLSHNYKKFKKIIYEIRDWTNLIVINKIKK